MKPPVILQAEFNENAIKAEARYTEVREAVDMSLRRVLQVRSALATYEYKLEKANAEFMEELKVIDSNFSK